MEKLTPEKIAQLAESNHYHDQAAEHCRQRKYEQAAALYKQAIEARKKVMGEADHGRALLLDELGFAYLKAGQSDKALASFQEALSLLETLYYAGHYFLGPVLEHMGDAACNMSKWEEAEGDYKRALDIYDKTLSGEHRSTLVTMHKLASVLRNLEKYADAEAVLNKGLKQIDTPLGPAEEFRYELARLYEAQGKTQEAETNFKQAVAGFRQRRNLPRLGTCLETFAAFLAKSGRKEESEEIAHQAKMFKQMPRDEEKAEDFFPATLLRA